MLLVDVTDSESVLVSEKAIDWDRGLLSPRPLHKTTSQTSIATEMSDQEFDEKFYDVTSSVSSSPYSTPTLLTTLLPFEDTEKPDEGQQAVPQVVADTYGTRNARGGLFTRQFPFATHLVDSSLRGETSKGGIRQRPFSVWSFRGEEALRCCSAIRCCTCNAIATWVGHRGRCCVAGAFCDGGLRMVRGFSVGQARLATAS